MTTDPLPHRRQDEARPDQRVGDRGVLAPWEDSPAAPPTAQRRRILPVATDHTLADGAASRSTTAMVAVMTASARALARQAWRDEAGDRQEPEALAEAAERAFARLRARLTTLIGLAGYQALFARAVRMARDADPALGLLTIEGPAGSSLEGARASAFAEDANPAEVAAGLTAIFAHLIELLIIFIGEDLAMRLTREA